MKRGTRGSRPLLVTICSKSTRTGWSRTGRREAGEEIRLPQAAPAEQGDSANMGRPIRQPADGAVFFCSLTQLSLRVTVLLKTIFSSELSLSRLKYPLRMNWYCSVNLACFKAGSA